MKKQFLLLALLLLRQLVFASDEHICVGTGGSEKCTPNSLGPVPPCAQIEFIAKGTPPTGGVFSKFEWYVNGALVKSTTNPSDNILSTTITSHTFKVRVDITYEVAGTLDGPYPSSEFIPIVKWAKMGEIATSTPPPVYGCTTPVSYSLNAYTCSGPGAVCDLFHDIGSQYTITWEPPSGWTQTAIDTRGNNVSFQPNGASEGTLTATIHLPCGYTETRTYSVSRSAPPTVFSNSNYLFCSSPGSVTIGAMCGASDYTYTISGYPGVTFASNGLTTLTTSATSVSVNVPSGSTSNTIKVKVNYPGSHSSTEVSAAIQTGAPIVYNSYYSTLEGTFTLNEWTGGPGNENTFCYHGVPTDVTTSMNFLGTGSVEWEKISPTSNAGIVWSQEGDNLVMAFKSILFQPVFRVAITNACGSSSAEYKFIPEDCGFLFRLSPNPTSQVLQLSIAPLSSSDSKMASNKVRSIRIVQIFDVQGNLKKQVRLNDVQQATIDVSQLPRGLYLVEISNGTYKERQQLSIQR